MRFWTDDRRETLLMRLLVLVVILFSLLVFDPSEIRRILPHHIVAGMLAFVAVGVYARLLRERRRTRAVLKFDSSLRAASELADATDRIMAALGALAEFIGKQSGVRLVLTRRQAGSLGLRGSASGDAVSLQIAEPPPSGGSDRFRIEEGRRRGAETARNGSTTARSLPAGSTRTPPGARGFSLSGPWPGTRRKETRLSRSRAPPGRSSRSSVGSGGRRGIRKRSKKREERSSGPRTPAGRRSGKRSSKRKKRSRPPSGPKRRGPRSPRRSVCSRRPAGNTSGSRHARPRS